MNNHRGFCIEGWEDEEVYNAMANLGIKLPPNIPPETDDVRVDLLAFFEKQTLMTEAASKYLIRQLERLIEKKLDERGK